MAARGKSSTSVSGASTSKYDVEVEARLKTLEEKILSPSEIVDSGDDKIAQLEKRFEALVAFLNENSYITANCPKNSDGKRQFEV